VIQVNGHEKKKHFYTIVVWKCFYYGKERS